MTLMTLSFFWAGCAAAAIPILLHLLMKGRKKRVTFPAFVFIQKTEGKNKKKLTLKHLLLLFLRISLFLLLGLLLARPVWDKVQSANSALDDPETPHGGTVAMVFDTSIRMDYQEANHSRLDRAKSLAQTLLSRFPANTRVAIFDSLGDQDSFQVDLLAAKERIDQLQPGPQRRPLAESVIQAIQLLKTPPPSSKEIFIFTDRSEAAWPETLRGDLHRALNDEDLANENNQNEKDAAEDSEKKTVSPIAFYYVDFSAASTENKGIRGITLTHGTDGGKFNVKMDVHLEVSPAAPSGLIELYLLDNTPPSKEEKTSETLWTERAVKKQTESFHFAKEDASEETKGPMQVAFRLSDLSPGFYQGFFKMTPGDALAADDIFWFAFNLQSEGKILLTASDPAAEKTIFLREALAPEEWRQNGLAPYEIETLSFNDFNQTEPDLSDKKAILFLDTPPLSKRNWEKIADFTRQGGGVGFFLGKESVPVDGFDDSNSLALLGGKPIRQVRAAKEEGTFFTPVSLENSILSPLRTWAEGGKLPWMELPVFRYWKMETAPNETSMEILRYSNGDPALWLRRFGEGRVIVATTPFSDSPNSPDAWNRLVTGDAAWIFLVLADGIAKTLTFGGSDTGILSPFEIFQTSIAADSHFSDRLRVLLPNGESLVIPSEKGENRIRFAGTRAVGLYRIEPDVPKDSDHSENAAIQTGFAVNYPASDFELRKISPEALEKYWSPTKLQGIDPANERETESVFEETSFEFFSILAVLLGLVWIMETIAAARFYR